MESYILKCGRVDRRVQSAVYEQRSIRRSLLHGATAALIFDRRISGEASCCNEPVLCSKTVNNVGTLRVRVDRVNEC